MLRVLKEQFAKAYDMEKAAHDLLKRELYVGRIITFHKGNMKQNDNAEVLSVSGRRVKIRNQFSKAERWIDFSDIKGI